MELKIVVPVHIPEFVPIIEQWNIDNMVNQGINIKTHFEKGDAPSGRNVRQKYTDIYAGTDNYIHWLDCDNLVNGQVFHWLEHHNYYKEPKIFMFSQIWWANGPKRLEAKPENCVPCKCDIAQLFVHGSFLKDMVWTNDYINDGIFIQQLFEKYENDFIFINDVNVWYNALKTNHGLYNGKVIQIA